MTAGLPSVVIPAFRAERTIVRTLESVIDRAAHVIIVVDGDLDRTASIVRDLQHPRITLHVEAENRGAQIARNIGLGYVTSPNVMFLDSDDYVEGDLLGALSQALDAGTDIAFGPMAIERGCAGRRDPDVLPDYNSAPDLFEKWFVERRFVAPCAVMWRVAFVRAIGGWDERVQKNQDGELVMRAALSGARIATVREGRGIYVKHGGPSVSSRADNLASLMVVLEMMLAFPGDIVPGADRRRACALHAYRIAWDCYDRGADGLGDVALARSRELGFRGHRGPWAHRFAGRLLGLRRKSHVVRWIKRALA